MQINGLMQNLPFPHKTKVKQNSKQRITLISKSHTWSSLPVCIYE